MIPYIGNLALTQAMVCLLSGNDPNFDKEETPTMTVNDMNAKNDEKQNVVTLRLTAVLELIDPSDKDKVLEQPDHTLSLLKLGLPEVRTFSWQSKDACITGYIWTTLRSAVTAYPAVTWYPMRPWRCMHRHLEKRWDNRAWIIWGVPSHWGPTAVLSWLKDAEWVAVSVKPPTHHGSSMAIIALMDQKSGGFMSSTLAMRSFAFGSARGKERQDSNLQPQSCQPHDGGKPPALLLQSVLPCPSRRRWLRLAWTLRLRAPRLLMIFKPSAPMARLAHLSRRSLKLKAGFEQDTEDQQEPLSSTAEEPVTVATECSLSRSQCRTRSGKAKFQRCAERPKPWDFRSVDKLLTP